MVMDHVYYSGFSYSFSLSLFLPWFIISSYSVICFEFLSTSSVGLSQCLDKYIDILRQPRYVEYEVCNMGQAVSWAAILSESLESNPEPRQRIRHPWKRSALWQSRRTPSLKSRNIKMICSAKFFLFYFYLYILRTEFIQLRACLVTSMWLCTNYRTDFLFSLFLLATQTGKTDCPFCITIPLFLLSTQTGKNWLSISYYDIYFTSLL